jgi:hypothetical protein
MHILTLLFACEPDSPPPHQAGPAEPDPIDPSPWTFASGDDELPALDLDAVERAIDAAVPAILAYDAEGVVGAYDTMLTSSTPDCPTVTTDEYGNQFWIDGCAAPDGTYYGGFLYEYVYQAYYDPYSGLVLDGSSLSGNVWLDGVPGTMDLEGTALWVTGQSTDGSLRVVESALSGGFYYDRADGWLGESSAVTTSLIAYTLPAFGGIAVVADGAAPVQVDGDRYDVVFHAAGMANQMAGSLCEDEPGGSVDVRDPYGRWVTVAFQGPNIGYDGGDPDHCDGCGDATSDGTSIGTVCPDFTPWFDWEKLP